ncbi:MAG: glycosyltransferase [Thermoplasmata archaeon]
MKILILTDEFPKDILNFNVDLMVNADYLSKMGHKVYLASHGGNKIDKSGFYHLPLGATYHRPKDSFDSFVIRNLTFFLGILKRIKKISPDIILCMGGGQYLCNFSTGLFLSNMIDVPIVCEWRGSELLLKNNISRQILKKRILRKSSLNIVRSKQMLNYALEIDPQANILIAPSKGVDLEHFKPASDKNLEKEIKILYVGRLHKIKGLTYLIDAFLKLNKNYPTTRLTIVGEGELKRDMIDKIKNATSSEHVQFVGEVDHERLPQYYRNSHIFVLPSLSEGLSNVIMEAMACGLPVIATDVGGNGELVKDGLGGFTVKPGNSDTLSTALEKLIASPPLTTRMGDYNRKYIQKFEQNKIMSKRMNIIQEVVDKA